jgi:hypothetical protein
LPRKKEKLAVTLKNCRRKNKKRVIVKLRPYYLYLYIFVEAVGGSNGP